MDLERGHRNAFFVGIALSLISLTLAFFRIPHWYYLGVIGIWLFFDYLAHFKTKQTAFRILQSNKRDFFRLYFFLFLLGLLIEVVGRYFLNYWNYPYIKYPAQEILLLIYYPFILMSFREMYHALKIKFKRKIIVFILAMIVGIFIWEIPNLFSKDWIYTVPYLTGYEIYGIHIVVIAGWSFLILLPPMIYDYVLKGKMPKK